MKLNVKPYRSNSYPTGGVFVRGAALKHWVQAIQELGLSPETVNIYPLPGSTANSVWGCLLELPANAGRIDTGKHIFCQVAAGLVFLPPFAVLNPVMTQEELHKLLKGERYAFHPETGWVLLPQPLDIGKHLLLPPPIAAEIRQPAKPVFVPVQVKSFQVRQPEPEQVLEAMDKNLFPEKQDLADKPLSIVEKIKLSLLRSLFMPSGKEKKYSTAGGTERKPWLEKLAGFLPGSKALDALADKLQQHFEDLEKRNQKMMDKLLDMFKNNPDEALKYAIPVDEGGTGRGGHEAAFDLSKRWGDFSLFGNTRAGSGSAVLGDSHMRRLVNQYTETAEALKKRKEYEKAAFVYLKLLKNPQQAAKALEEGNLYGEAAAIYLKHCKDVASAAACYERGRMTMQAIDLYKQLNEEEKVGDLYISINDKKNAFYHYGKVADRYEGAFQFVKASLLYKNKMANTEKAQQLLLQGWRAGSDANNCLGNYFANIPAELDVTKAIDTIYKDEVNAQNEAKFLLVIQQEHARNKAAEAITREIAYEIIARQAVENPGIVSELKAFNKADKHLIKDVLKYKQFRKTIRLPEKKG
jgi:hypothetical protein